MNRIALALAAVIATSGPLFANDFSGSLVYPTQSPRATHQAAPAAKKPVLDYSSTRSIVAAPKAGKTDRTAKSEPAARRDTSQKSGPSGLEINPFIVPSFR